MKKIRALIYAKYGLLDVIECSFFGFPSQYMAEAMIKDSIETVMERYKGEITEINIKVRKVNRQFNDLYID